VRQEFPLLSLSIGVVHLHPQACAELDASQLESFAGEASCEECSGYSVHVIDSLSAELHRPQLIDNVD
jgi:hypothetical protein